MDSKIKQEIPEDSFQNSFKIENSNDNLDEIVFKNCDVKDEITDETNQVEDPLKVGGLKSKTKIIVSLNNIHVKNVHEGLKNQK